MSFNSNDQDKQSVEFETSCKEAAKAIAEADILLLVTGAGWGADSGLAVYADIAKIPSYRQRGLDYADICQPHWIHRDPALFYGFWGQCFQDYRTTKPHEGYEIVAKWRDQINVKKEKTAESIRTRLQRKISLRRPFDTDQVQDQTPYQIENGEASLPGAFFSFTSNVDAHFFDHLKSSEIHDCHGNVELWQCSSRDCVSGIWRAPISYNFVVDSRTMLAPANKDECNENDTTTHAQEKRDEDAGDDETLAPHIGHTMGVNERTHTVRFMPPAKDNIGWKDLEPHENWPKCGHCEALARPAILMFGDAAWKCHMTSGVRWELWRETVVEQVTNVGGTEEPPRLVVLEIGCGMNVPTCRWEAEAIVSQTVEEGGSATFIRINTSPEDQRVFDQSIKDSSISIKSTGLRAVQQIDKALHDDGNYYD